MRIAELTTKTGVPERQIRYLILKPRYLPGTSLDQHIGARLPISILAISCRRWWLRVAKCPLLTDSAL